MLQGTIIRVAGPVVDVQFAAGKLPALQEALTVTAEGTERTMEVTQHVNETTVRCIMLSASEGLGKGMTVQATGHGLTAPVGEATLGRMFDPLGRPIDGKGPVDDVPHWPIHRKAPSFAEQKPATEILETGIKRRIIQFVFFRNFYIPKTKVVNHTILITNLRHKNKTDN